MKQKPNIDRKQKRAAKKIVLFCLVIAGMVSAVGAGTFYYITIEMSKPLYVSPLASMKFAQASQKDNQVELLKRELQKEQIAYTKIEKTAKDVYIVTLKQGGAVTFSGQKDIIKQIASLQFILSHLTMEDKLFSRLDLRFEKPVIVPK
ncbi:MAG: hypothetical protein H0W89_00030 [Candidatus Levybacteria bacterium]|nr:hypothetical protein [Candidatus Levybacteria bacterium]